jgi:hypothetical protein
LNEAKGDQIKVGKIYETFGLSTAFDPAHLKLLPGTNSVWAQLVGEHEGEHCNQDPIYNTDKNVEVKELEGEAKSDRAALETIQKEGHMDVYAAWKALRVINAANGDISHATSIFLDDPEFKGVTEEHLEAAKTFRGEMNMGVAANLGISIEDASNLRTDNPQKYASSAEDALKKGELPVIRDVSEKTAKLLVAKRMGFSEENVDSVDKSSSAEISAVYQALKAEGALKDRGPQNPYVNKYIQNYIDGTRVLFTKETTPAPKAEAAPTSDTAPEPDPVPTEEELAVQTIVI